MTDIPMPERYSVNNAAAAIQCAITLFPVDIQRQVSLTTIHLPDTADADRMLILTRLQNNTVTEDCIVLRHCGDTGRCYVTHAAENGPELICYPAIGDVLRLGVIGITQLITGEVVTRETKELHDADHLGRILTDMRYACPTSPEAVQEYMRPGRYAIERQSTPEEVNDKMLKVIEQVTPWVADGKLTTIQHSALRERLEALLPSHLDLNKYHQLVLQAIGADGVGGVGEQTTGDAP